MVASIAASNDVQRQYILSIFFVLFVAFALILLPEMGHARRTTTYTGPAGRTVQKSTGWSASPSGVHRSSTVAGPNGYSATGQTIVHRTGNGYSSNTTMYGPNGNSVNRSSTGTWDPVTNTWIKNTTTTGPAGNSYSTSRSTSFSQ